MSTATATATRVVTLITTRGAKEKVEFSGTTWKELKSLLTNKGHSFNNVKVVESATKTTLEHPEAIVPTVDFSLFFMQVKTKSGGEVRNQVKALFEANREVAKAHFGNYTQKKEDDLASLLKSYKGSKAVSAGASTKASPKPAANTKPAVIPPVTKAEKSEGNNGIHAKLDLIISILQNGKAGKVVEPASKTSNSLSDAEETRKLNAERESLMSGFNDVKRY